MQAAGTNDINSGRLSLLSLLHPSYSLTTDCVSLLTDTRFVCLQRGSPSKLARKDRRGSGDDGSSASDADLAATKVKQEPKGETSGQECRANSNEKESESRKRERSPCEARRRGRSSSPDRRDSRHRDRSPGELSGSPHTCRKRRFQEQAEPEALYSSSKYRRRDNSPVRERRSPVRGVRRRHVFSPEDIQTPRDQFRRRNWSVLSSPTVNPCDRSTPGWYDSHEQYKSLCRVQSDVVLVGDSIIKGLGRYPRVWRKYFGRLNALNFGIGGDRTQHVLWRVQNGELECHPKVVVIHCGTNNIDKNSPGDIVQGLLTIVDYIRAKRPAAMIVVVGLLPRDLHLSYRRSKVDQVNSDLEERISFSDELKEESVYFLKPDDDWVEEDGKLVERLYYTDHLHLVEAGNEKLAKAISDFVQRLMNEEVKGERTFGIDDIAVKLEFGGSDLRSLIKVFCFTHCLTKQPVKRYLIQGYSRV